MQAFVETPPGEWSTYSLQLKDEGTRLSRRGRCSLTAAIERLAPSAQSEHLDRQCQGKLTRTGFYKWLELVVGGSSAEVMERRKSSGRAAGAVPEYTEHQNSGSD